jgi:integrase
MLTGKQSIASRALPERDDTMKLDAKKVAKLALPEGKLGAIYFDADLAGFGLRLRASAGHVRRTWIAQYRAHGRTRRMKVGDAEKLGADDARKAARKVLAKVELGQDPQGDKAKARLASVRTLRSVADDYLEAKESVLRPVSYRGTKLYLTGPYFKPLHSTTITDITLADVAARIGAIARNNGSVAACRARSALSAMYRWAMGEGLLGPHPINPVIGTNTPPDSTPRERVLSDVELAAIWHACADDDHGRIVKLLALTGCRRDEIGGMRWSEISTEKDVLALPKERTKNGRAHAVPLTPLALTILETVPRRADGRDHVFGERSPVGFTMWTEAKRDLDHRLAGQVKEWRVHDLRRTTATRMADLGVQPHIIEAVLNHYSGHRRGVAGVHNRSPYEREVRAAMALWAAHVQSIVEGGERKIVSLRA